MRRVCLQAARALAVAGLLTLPPVILAGLDSAPTTDHKPPAPAMVRLGALRVELAWLADPATFGYPLQARITHGGLEVCGFVPDVTTKVFALRLANEHSGLTVLDSIVLDSSLSARRPAQDAAALKTAAADALKSCKCVTNLKLQVVPGGRIEVYGTVHSIEEMRTVSRCLVMVQGCTSVDNRLSVMPVKREGKVMTQVTADGSLCLQGTVHFHVYEVAANVGGENSAPPAPPQKSEIAVSTAPMVVAERPAALVTPVDTAVTTIPTSAPMGAVHANVAPPESQGWDANTDFASHELPRSDTSQSQQTQFASSKDRMEAAEIATTRSEASDFAAAEKQQSLQPVSSLVAASGDNTGSTQTRTDSAAIRSMRPHPARVVPMTSNGQWPSAFVGGQPMKLPTDWDCEAAIGQPIAAGSPASSATVMRSPTWRAQLPSPILLAQLKEQVQILGGQAVRNVDLHYQEDKTVILAVSIADGASERMILDRVLQLDGLADSGVGIEFVKAK